MSSKLIEVEGITVRYDSQVVLTSVSFGIEKGDYIGLVGANGSGKTTLVKAILGLVPLENGQVIKHIIDGQVMRIGYLPQVAVTGNSLFPAEVHEIVATGLLGQKKFPKRITKNDTALVDDILQRLDIFGLKNKRIGDLSGGQQQRVLLARAMVSKPQMLILDEPTSALDPRVRESFFHLIGEINQNEGTSILLVSHDLGSIKRYAHKMMLLDREIVYFGDVLSFDSEFGIAKGLHHHAPFGGINV